MDIIGSSYPGSAVFGLILATHGYRKGSLSLSGAICAALVGYLSLANPLRIFGVLLIVFYLIGSRVTKVKTDYKASLEEPETSSHSQDSTRAQGGGNRNAYQVLCNGYLGCAAAIAWRVLYSGEKEMSKVTWTGNEFCAAEQETSRQLVFLTIAFFAACMGDTLSSELGILSSRPPFMITSFRIVPRGTNGAISPLGTVLALIGGTIIGLCGAVSLMVLNPACREYSWKLAFEVVLYGSVSGLVGSLIDSILGATVQVSLYSEKSKRIVHSKTNKSDDEDKITVISGLDILSNNTVNIIASTITALAAAIYSM